MRDFIRLEKIGEIERGWGYKIRWMKPADNEVWYTLTGSYIRRGRAREKK